jgi:hypothetical protein
MFAQLEVAFGNLLLIEPIEFHLLPQHEQQLVSPISFQALSDLLQGGFDLGFHEGGQRPGIALPFQNGSNDVHSTDAAQVAQYIAELNIHLD